MLFLCFFVHQFDDDMQNAFGGQDEGDPLERNSLGLWVIVRRTAASLPGIVIWSLLMRKTLILETACMFAWCVSYYSYTNRTLNSSVPSFSPLEWGE